MNSDFREYLNRRKALFWDIDLVNYDFQQNTAYLISRILEFGTWKDVQMLLKNFQTAEITDVVVNSKYISPKTATFWLNKFNIQEQIRCLQPAFRKQHSQLWNG